MLHKFPELRDKNISRIYNMPTKYAQYAFDIPNDELKVKYKELCIRNEEAFIKKYGIEEGDKTLESI